MSSYGGKELASAFRTVRKNTIQVAEDSTVAVRHVAARSVNPLRGAGAHRHCTRLWEDIHRSGA